LEYGGEQKEVFDSGFERVLDIFEVRVRGRLNDGVRSEKSLNCSNWRGFGRSEIDWLTDDAKALKLLLPGDYYFNSQ
jgi:hypothetical protein